MAGFLPTWCAPWPARQAPPTWCAPWPPCHAPSTRTQKKHLPGGQLPPPFFFLFLAHFSWLFRLTAHGGHQGWEGGGAWRGGHGAHQVEGAWQGGHGAHQVGGAWRAGHGAHQEEGGGQKGHLDVRWHPGLRHPVLGLRNHLLGLVVHRLVPLLLSLGTLGVDSFLELSNYLMNRKSHVAPMLFKRILAK